MSDKKSLVIVESPAKAKTINKYLGNKYQVLASMGHIKDLPEHKLGVDIKHNFKPKYEIIPERKKTLIQLKKAAAPIDTIFLAPDPDREGEAIAWHLAEELGNGKSVYRLIFHEITRHAVQEALKHPTQISHEKVEAQQARRILDRLVGYQISPILSKKLRQNLSAGRVQSVAVLLICEREKEIAVFVPEEYWSITANLRKYHTENIIVAKLDKINNKKVNIPNKVRADEILADISGKRFVISNITKKQKIQKPAPPFTTSKLQQEASRKLKFTAKKTMVIAQQLYEGLDIGKEAPVGLITYMRTDSVRIAESVQQEAAEYICERYGKEYIPATPPKYTSRKGAQEAHEAIRPTFVRYTPDEIKEYLTQDQYKLYKLIWNRFIASQMSPAQLEVTTAEIIIEAKDKYLFKITGSVVKFPGFTAVYVEGKDEVEDEEKTSGELPSLSKGEELELINLEPKQHFTQPPPRYTEATLVKALEEKGIGRPSTYAPIITTIQERGYVEKIDGKFRPTELGTLVTEMLKNAFPDIINVDFTAKMEENLDKVEEGKIHWVKVLEEFYQPFSYALTQAGDKIQEIKKQQEVVTDILCERCGAQMIVRFGKLGKFLGCSNYPTCKYTTPFEIEEDGRIKIKPQETVEEVCEICGAQMLVKESKKGKFLACSAYPECKNTKPFGKEVDKINKPEPTSEKCPKCDNLLVIKDGKYGKFLSCSNYPKCKYTKSVGIGVMCPECGGNIVRKVSRKGCFYGCENYPECKFATWDEPTNSKCPACNKMLVKKIRKGNEYMFCINEDCSYNEGR